MNFIKLLIFSLLIFSTFFVAEKAIAERQLTFNTLIEAQTFCNSRSINCIGINFEGEPGIPAVWVVIYECVNSSDGSGKGQEREAGDGKVCDF